MWERIQRSGRALHKAAFGFLGTLLIHALLGWMHPAAAQEGFVVIVNPSNPVTSVSRDELSRIFLKKTSAWGNGSRAMPADLAASSSVRARFSEEIHGKDTSAVKAYWQKMIFSGRGIPPAELASPAEVIAFVAANRGAIGYVAEDVALGTNIKAIRVAP